MKTRLLSTLAGVALLLGAQAASAQAVRIAQCYDHSQANTNNTPPNLQAAQD